MNEKVRSGFAALLRQYRHAAGLSQEALAERTGLSADAIAALERGRRTPGKFDLLRQRVLRVA